MFHCGGTACVYEVTGHDEYIVRNCNAVVIPKNDESEVLTPIRKLRRDPEWLAFLKAGARETAEAWPDWNSASRVFLDGIDNIMNQPKVPRDLIREANRAAFEAYVADDAGRLAEKPWRKLYHIADSLLDRMPEWAARRVRLGRYIAEGWW